MSPITEHYIYRCGPNCPLPNTDHPATDASLLFSTHDSIYGKEYTILKISYFFSVGEETGYEVYGVDNSTINPQIEALKKAHKCAQKSMEKLKISDENKSKK